MVIGGTETETTISGAQLHLPNCLTRATNAKDVTLCLDDDLIKKAGALGNVSRWCSPHQINSSAKRDTIA